MLVSSCVSLSTRIAFSHPWRTLPLKPCQLPQAPWPFRSASLGIPPTHALSKTKSAHLKSQVCALLLISLILCGISHVLHGHNSNCYLLSCFSFLVDSRSSCVFAWLGHPAPVLSSYPRYPPEISLTACIPPQCSTRCQQGETSKRDSVSDSETYSGC